MISQAVKNFIFNSREDLDNDIDRFLSNGLLELDENDFLQLCRVLLASGISEILSFPHSF